MKARRRLGTVVLSGVLLGIFAPSAGAQDTNYWALQYGPVGQLLGGQVIGSERSLSATYYNPGGLALEDGTTFLLSTESFLIESFDTAPAADVDVFDTSSTRLGAAPTLVAGSLPRSWLGDDTRLAWSFLTRQDLNSRLGERLTDPFGFEPQGGGSASELYLDNRVNESWLGLTASRRLSDTLGAGGTLYGIYRGQRNRTEINAQALAPTIAAFSALAVTTYDYTHFRTLAKLGMAWERNDMRFGLNVTTPSLGLLGWGSAGSTLSFIGVDADGDGVPDPPLLSSQTEDDLDATYKSSWAVGGGFAWYRGATRWHASAEWFAPVDRFTVLDLPQQDEDEQLILSQQLKSVVNFGLGLEHDFQNGTVVYGAAYTDFSASVGDPEINVAVSNWNLYHLSAGVQFRVISNRFTLGATYSFGSAGRPLSSGIPEEPLPGVGLADTLDVSYKRVVVLLGFLFGDGN
jgi:hypothetical protein